MSDEPKRWLTPQGAWLIAIVLCAGAGLMAYIVIFLDPRHR
jgi:hypothetical protein